MQRKQLWRSVAADLEALNLPDGEPFKLLKWEREFIKGAFADDVRRIGLSIPRKNGKTELAAGLSVSALCGALAQLNGEVIVVASSFEQAKIAFRSVLAMMRPRLEADGKRWRVQESSNRASIEDRETGSQLRCIGSDARRAHGLRPHFVLMDEVAQWPQGGEEMVSALVTGIGGRECRLMMTGTRPADPEHALERWLRNADYVYAQSADPDADPLAVATYRACNPSWRRLPELRDAIKRDIAEAAADPSAMPRLRALRGNLGMADTDESMLIDPETWRRCEGEAERAGAPVFGVDLGTTASMSAVAAYWPNTGRLEALAALPTIPGVVERERLDGAIGKYSAMMRAGELVEMGQRVINVSELIKLAVDRFGQPQAVVTDRWRKGELQDALAKARVRGVDPIFRGTGERDGAEDVRTFRRACLAGNVHAERSVLLRYAIGECRTKRNDAGNEKLKRARRRSADDAGVAAMIATAEGYRRRNKPRRKVRYLGVTPKR